MNLGSWIFKSTRLEKKNGYGWKSLHVTQAIIERSESVRILLFRENCTSHWHHMRPETMTAALNDNVFGTIHVEIQLMTIPWNRHRISRTSTAHTHCTQTFNKHNLPASQTNMAKCCTIRGNRGKWSESSKQNSFQPCSYWPVSSKSQYAWMERS